MDWDTWIAKVEDLCRSDGIEFDQPTRPITAEYKWWRAAWEDGETPDDALALYMQEYPSGM